ncbi:unnamed protein product [Chilo suppressalis]|uniref:Uncharacterized protein n=1 Tax=Chilo suppressalis TaxID=168631 RepID=A0ABN8B3G6_CHISP|nr:unnamed protein product [Chilo suppressalis]
MPRNYPRFHKNGPQNQNGPLMTDHIELRDLDLELELLKRKRQMIEQQQQQLSNERHYNNQPRNYNFNQSPQMYQAPQQQYNSTQFSSHTFGQSGPSFNHFEGGQGTSLGKRQSDSRWNPSSAPKRFSGPTGGSKKKFSAGFKSRSDSLADRPAPFVNQQAPISKQHSQNVTQSQQQAWNQLPFYMGNNKYTPPSQRFKSTKAKPAHTDFRPTKVTKSKVTSANIGYKLVTYPIPKRKVPTKEVPKSASKADEKGDFILHADRVPTQQVAGRLELALGNILKDVKQKYGEDDEYKASFLHHIFLREVKQAIRERLRTVMLGKHVGKVEDTVEHYRKVFPIESDKEMVDLAMEVLNVVKRKLLITKLDETDSPENYFKVNIDKLLDTSLDEMFRKLQKIYGADSIDYTKELFTEDTKEKSDAIDVDNEKNKVENVDAAEDVESKENTENSAADAFASAQSNQNVENTETTESEQNLENIEAVESERNTEAAESEQNIATTDDNKEETKNEENSIEDENIKKEENKNNEHISEVNTEASASIDANADGQENTLVDPQKRVKKMEYMMKNIINRKLASLLPKYKLQMIKILRANEKYNATKELLLTKLQYKLSVEKQMEKASGKGSASLKTPVKASPHKTKPDSSTPASTPRTTSLYYAKVHGRPFLPRKKEMQSFLQKFNPKSVKKHRSMQLLFVGFDNKENFDKMLEIQETIIDEKRVIIKAGEVTDKNQKSLNVSVISDDDDEVQVVKENNTSGDIVGSDLDGQIDDLLTSIRKEEESSQVEKTEDATKEVVAVDDKTKDSKPNGDDNNEVQVIANGNQKDVVTIDDENEVEEVPDNSENDVEIVPDASAETPKKDEKLESESNKASENTESEAADKVEALKSDAKQTGRSTPTRASARINNSTPSSIRTRRASRLAQD